MKQLIKVSLSLSLIVSFNIRDASFGKPAMTHSTYVNRTLKSNFLKHIKKLFTELAKIKREENLFR